MKITLVEEFPRFPVPGARASCVAARSVSGTLP